MVARITLAEVDTVRMSVETAVERFEEDELTDASVLRQLVERA